MITGPGLRRRAPLRRRTPTSSAIGVLLLAGPTAACGPTESAKNTGCLTYDAARSDARIDGLDLSPARPGAGELIQVSRSDGTTMDYSSAFLYADREAGCRLFALVHDGAGETWVDVTDQTEFMISSDVELDARARSYRIPSDARGGSYLICVEVSEPDSDVSEMCVEFDL